jgi:hypothetical protein
MIFFLSSKGNKVITLLKKTQNYYLAISFKLMTNISHKKYHRTHKPEGMLLYPPKGKITLSVWIRTVKG